MGKNWFYARPLLGVLSVKKSNLFPFSPPTNLPFQSQKKRQYDNTFSALYNFNHKICIPYFFAAKKVTDIGITCFPKPIKSCLTFHFVYSHYKSWLRYPEFICIDWSALGRWMSRVACRFWERLTFFRWYFLLRCFHDGMKGERPLWYFKLKS